MKRKVIAFVSDLLIAALLLGGIYGVNCLIPQTGIIAQTMTAQAAGVKSQTVSGREKELQTLVDKHSNGLPTTKVSLDSQDWRQKFADKFTDQVISTDTSYSSPDISVQITHNSYNTNRLDMTQDGKHMQYGTNDSGLVQSADGFYGAFYDSCIRFVYCFGDSWNMRNLSAKTRSGYRLRIV